jgi:hypothetical protein
MPKSPKTDALRAMREKRFEEREKQSSKPSAGKRIVKSLRQAVEIAQGKRKPARVTTVKVPRKHGEPSLSS